MIEDIREEKFQEIFGYTLDGKVGLANHTRKDFDISNRVFDLERFRKIMVDLGMKENAKGGVFNKFLSDNFGKGAVVYFYYDYDMLSLGIKNKNLKED